MSYFRTGTRKELVRRQKMIIDHINLKSRSHEANHLSIREAFHDFSKDAKKHGLVKSNAILRDE